MKAADIAEAKPRIASRHGSQYVDPLFAGRHDGTLSLRWRLLASRMLPPKPADMVGLICLRKSFEMEALWLCVPNGKWLNQTAVTATI